MFGFFRTRLFNNIMHLTLIQGVAFILPLMAFPYLVKVLGMDHYGKFIFYQLIVQYITLCSDFGFNFLATQKIAKNQCNLYKVTVIFWTTLWSKAFLILLLLSVLWAIVFTIDITFDYILFFMFLPQLIAGVLMPTWLFQGKEEMKILSFATIGIRAVNVALIFLLVKHYNDINTVALIQSLCSFFLVIVVYFYIYKKRWIGFYYFKYSRIIFFIKSSFPYFISVISVNLYTSFPAFIIGITLGTQSVAYYNIANTIRNAMQSLLNPIYQSLFPRINNIYSVNKDAAKKLIKRSLLIVSCLVFIFSIFVFIFSPLVIQLITSGKNESIVIILRVLCFVPFLSSICNILGVQAMIPFGFQKQFTLITICAGILCLAIIYPMLIAFGVIGGAYSVLLTELFVLTFFSCFLLKRGFFKVNKHFG